MAKTGSAYDKGRAAFYQGKLRKPTNDGVFVQDLNQIGAAGQDLQQIRKEKTSMVDEWKRGWDEAKAESMAEAAPKKKKKKTSKKKSKK